MDKKILESIVRPSVLPLEPYNPGPSPEARVRIMANENNLGVGEKALRAMTKEILLGNRYPDITCGRLRERLAEKHGLSPEQIIVGNGLDGVFTMLGRAFVNEGDEVLHGEFTFSVYSDMAKIMGGSPVAVPMTERLELDTEGFIKRISGRIKLLFLCNPNNPTGSLIPLEGVKRLLDAAPENTLVIADEAYIEFSKTVPTALPLLSEHPNLIVCRTFSKMFGLAGLRVGWAAADPDLISQLYKVREPYCVNSIAEAAAEAALEDEDYLADSRALVSMEKLRFYTFFDENGIKYYPSEANFILTEFSGRTKEIYEGLFSEGILTRLMSYRGKDYIRFSIGETEENLFTLERLKTML